MPAAGARGGVRSELAEVGTLLRGAVAGPDGRQRGEQPDDGAHHGRHGHLEREERVEKVFLLERKEEGNGDDDQSELLGEDRNGLRE